MENNMNFERGQSIFTMLGGYEPSRATNPSDGTDPVSMGMLPAARGAAVPSAPPHAEPPAPEPDREPAGGQQVAPTNEDVVLLQRGVALLRGRAIPLMPEHTQYIVSILMHALELSMANEILTMRQEYGLLETNQLGQMVQSPDNGTGMVRPMQGEEPEADGSGAPEHSDPVLQEMPKAKDKKRSLRLVPSPEPGEPTPNS